MICTYMLYFYGFFCAILLIAKLSNIVFIDIYKPCRQVSSRFSGITFDAISQLYTIETSMTNAARENKTWSETVASTTSFSFSAESLI